MRTVGILLASVVLCSSGAALARQGAGARKHPARKHPRRASPGATSATRATGAAKPPARAPRAASRETLDRFARGSSAFFDGDYAAAERELAPLAASGARLLNRDAALFFLASSEALLVPPAHARALGHFRAAAGVPHTRYGALARARAADMLFALGRFSEAKAAYQEVLRTAAPEVEPAVARFRLGEIAARAGDSRAALEAFRKVFVERPAHPLAERALGRMKELGPSLTISIDERLARAQRLSADHAWAEGLAELTGLAGEVPAALRDEVNYWIGTIHFKMRHGYDVAAQKLLGVWPRLPVARQPEALFHGARAWSRSGLDDGDDRAIIGYRELLGRFPHCKQAAEASFLVGWLDFNRGHYKEAIPGLEQCLQRYGGSSFNDDARWFLGFSRWMNGDAAGALAEFDQLARLSGALDGGKGRYWKARALNRLGHADEAVVVWRKLVADFPFTYYALQARVRLAEHKVTVGPFGDGAPDRKAAALGEVDERLAADPEVARVDELIRAGLLREAAAELDRVDGELLKRYGGRAVPLLIDRYLQAEDFHHSHRLAEAHAGGALRLDPHADPAARRWWELVYPLAYRKLVEKYAPTGHNPTYYLYTIMQKESAYNPHDLSYADAIGLLQMIPPTSRRVAERIGRPYTDDVLYDPEGNIQFGAWYIGRLLEKFKGQLALGAGSFNAGPQAMMKWLKKNGGRELDEFVELCPYTQTREYMKKVLDIYSHYVYLYEKQDYLPAEKVNPRYLENDIDY